MYLIIYTPDCNKDIEKVACIGSFLTEDAAKYNLCKFVNVDLSTLDEYQYDSNAVGWDTRNDEPDHLQYDFKLSSEKIEKLLDIYVSYKSNCANGHLFRIIETESNSIGDIIKAKKIYLVE